MYLHFGTRNGAYLHRYAPFTVLRPPIKEAAPCFSLQHFPAGLLQGSFLLPVHERLCVVKIRLAAVPTDVRQRIGRSGQSGYKQDHLLPLAKAVRHETEPVGKLRLDAPDQIFPPLDVLTEQRAQKHKLLFFIPDMRLLYRQLHLPQTVQHPFLPPGFFRGK